MTLRPSLSLSIALLCAACSPSPAPDPPGQPAGWDQDFQLPEAKDTNSDPNVVEVSLTARVASLEIVQGTKTPAWTYDGSIPGPLIHAKRGDRILVHFTNQLPEPTTVHWHGIRVPNAMDGVPDMPKPAVKPGESFDYDFVVPDAGLFWYHPHVDSSAQVGFGLYGALLVDDPDEPPGLGDPLVLVLSDIGVKPDGSLDAPDAGGALGAVFGREGDTILVNGRHLPKLLARAGRRQRWRIVNAARSRYFWLDTGAPKMTRIGGDGGRTSAPVDLDRLLLAPGERADVLLTPVASPGEEHTVRWIPFDRGYGTADLRPVEDVFTIQASAAAPDVSAAAPDASRAIEPISIAGAKQVEMKLTMDQQGDVITLGINGVPFDKAQPFPAKIGETQIWNVEDAMPWAHPFHLHGFFFQVIGDDGKPVAPLEWKDTVQVAVDGKVHLAVRFDDRPGMWMFHCHILDHADLGMMGMVDLEP